MPAPFSEDVRWRVSRLYMFFSIQLQRLHFFLGVSERTVERYISKFLVTGDVKSETIGHSYEAKRKVF